MKYLKSLSSLSSFQSVRQTSIVTSGWLCTVGGLVADVLQPLAPFAFYVFLLSLVTTATLSFLCFKGRKGLVGALVLSAIACLVMGFFTLLQQGDESEERGIVATTIPTIATLQDKLGLIEEKIDAIKEDTETIKDTTSRIESKSDQVIESLDTIKETIASFKTDGIINTPSSPEEHYHNARIHELGGDYSAARRSYLEYFKSDLPKLDPHLRFITFLKVQEGTAGARETYNAIATRSPSKMAPYAKILLLPTESRKQNLKDYFDENPSFAPAAYHLSLEFSELRLGSQTIANKRDELRYISAFQQADEQGGLLRHLIDQELAQEWRTDANSRKRTIENTTGIDALENPVSISWMNTNSGAQANIQIIEQALDIFWNIKGQSSPESVGQSTYNNPQTGKPAPNQFFYLPTNQQDCTIEISYTDAAGQKHGPYDFEYAAQKESNSSDIRILEMTKNSWGSFRDYDGKVFFYFSHLMAYRGTLSKIEYGANEETPNREFKFPAWNKAGIALIDETVPTHIIAPSSTQYITVQLTYKSGEKSTIARITRH
ncbi:hemolysin XhlA family protein [Puniceicoccaceae bacterium K14]|nr:hemolysin XhlA family protein [Puniceicoccaceae bacterium K14]